MSASWINQTIASRLAGVDLALFSKNAKHGCYGPIKPGPNGEIKVSTLGLELACQTVFTAEQIAAARAGRPITFSRDNALRDLLDNV